MNRLLPPLCFMLLVLLCATAASAQDEYDDVASENQVGGALYAGQFDARCQEIAQREGKKQNLSPMFAYAFYDKDSDSHMCLNILWGNDPSPRMFSYHVSAMDGMLLEALSPPMTSSSAPLQGCNIWDVYFDDYNKDGITDITLMIGCAPVGDSNEGRNDNAVYLSTISEDIVWLRQRQDLNAAVATFTEYNQVYSAIQATLTGLSTPTPPSSPPPPSPPSTGPASAGDSAVGTTCHYKTDSGTLSLSFYDTTSAVTGTFAQGGVLAGINDGIRTRGVWSLNNEQGDFEITHEKWGFFGHWKSRGDANWRGEWEGAIIRCE